MRNRYKTDAEKRADYLGYQRGYHAGIKKPVRHGRWRVNTIYKPYGTHCTNCGWAWVDNIDAVKLNRTLSKIKTRYCPNCGAKMDEVEE